MEQWMTTISNFLQDTVFKLLFDNPVCLIPIIELV